MLPEVEVDELVDHSSKEQRAALFDDLVGRLNSGAANLPAATVEYCISTTLRLIELADPTEHSLMSMRVARIPDLPPALAAALAKSRIAIAAPVLTLSGSLDEATILEIVRTAGKDHLLAVAGRADLTAAICNALLGRGSVDVAVALIDNPAAKLSPQAIEMLERLAARSAKLEERLCGRADLPEATARRLMEKVKMRLQLQLGAAMSGFDSEAIRMALRTREAETSSEVTDTQALSQGALVEVARLAARGELDETRLNEFIAEQRLELVACAFGRLSHVEPAIARRILLAHGTETLAVASRAIPLSTETYMNLVGLTRADAPPGGDIAARLAGDYESLPVETARKVMQLHRKRRNRNSSRRSEHSRPHDVALAARLGRPDPHPIGES
jgi:uncharacterized protein (DUF2336 family)